MFWDFLRTALVFYMESWEEVDIKLSIFSFLTQNLISVFQSDEGSQLTSTEQS